LNIVEEIKTNIRRQIEVQMPKIADRLTTKTYKETLEMVFKNICYSEGLSIDCSHLFLPEIINSPDIDTSDLVSLNIKQTITEPTVLKDGFGAFY